MHVPFPSVRQDGSRDGGFIAARDIESWQKLGGLDWNLIDGRRKKSNTLEDGEEYWIMSDADVAYEKASQTIDRAQTRYLEVVKAFRSEIKNDVSSIGASCEKMQKEITKLTTSFKEVESLMNSPSMLEAIKNAERLATAFSTLSDVKGSKLTFAVLSEG